MSATLHACELPGHALLSRYAGAGGYADCYSIEIAQRVGQAEYIEAFYTTRLFKLERALLAWFVQRPSTDAQARELAAGTRDTFAAWDVEARNADQLLLRDLHQRTRSWLMSTEGAGGRGTRLFFGSAVVPLRDRRTGEARMGAGFHALLGFHQLYSRALLRAAVAALARPRR